MAGKTSAGATVCDPPSASPGAPTSAPPITLAELCLVRDSYHKPSAAGAKDSKIQKLSPATWQGLATAARLLGSTGTSAKLSMKVVAGKFMGSTFYHELGSGELCAPDSRLYATVKKAEEAEQVEQDLRTALAHAGLQQAGLARDLVHASATI